MSIFSKSAIRSTVAFALEHKLATKPGYVPGKRPPFDACQIKQIMANAISRGWATMPSDCKGARRPRGKLQLPKPENRTCKCGATATLYSRGADVCQDCHANESILHAQK